MAINTQVSSSDWLEFFVSFSNGNQGRLLSLEEFDAESGSTGQVVQGKLIAVDYDPVDKGNDLVVTTGDGEIDNSHIVKAPVEVWKAQADDGEIVSLEIIDQNGAKTILRLS